MSLEISRRKMSAEANAHLVMKTYKELHERAGEVFDKLIGVEGSGYIPLELNAVDINKRASELGYAVAFHCEDEPVRENGLGRLMTIMHSNKELLVLLAEIDKAWWVANDEMEMFKELFFGNPNKGAV